MESGSETFALDFDFLFAPLNLLEEDLVVAGEVVEAADDDEVSFDELFVLVVEFVVVFVDAVSFVEFVFGNGGLTVIDN